MEGSTGYWLYMLKLVIIKGNRDTQTLLSLSAKDMYIQGKCVFLTTMDGELRHRNNYG